jgi:hypothetical protein
MKIHKKKKILIIKISKKQKVNSIKKNKKIENP